MLVYSLCIIVGIDTLTFRRRITNLRATRAWRTSVEYRVVPVQFQPEADSLSIWSTRRFHHGRWENRCAIVAHNFVRNFFFFFFFFIFFLFFTKSITWTWENIFFFDLFYESHHSVEKCINFFKGNCISKRERCILFYRLAKCLVILSTYTGINGLKVLEKHFYSWRKSCLFSFLKMHTWREWVCNFKKSDTAWCAYMYSFGRLILKLWVID